MFPCTPLDISMSCVYQFFHDFFFHYVTCKFSTVSFGFYVKYFFFCFQFSFTSFVNHMLCRCYTRHRSLVSRLFYFVSSLSLRKLCSFQCLIGGPIVNSISTLFTSFLIKCSCFVITCSAFGMIPLLFQHLFV